MNSKRPPVAENDGWDNYSPDKAYTGIAVLLIIIAIVCFFVVLTGQPVAPFQIAGQASAAAEGLKDPVKDYWTVKGTIGDFTAGIAGTLCSLAGFMLLYLSFKKQTDANAVQLQAFMHDKVEGRFFELLKLYRDNVSELKFEVIEEQWIESEQGMHLGLKPKVYETRTVFLAILEQFELAYQELSPFFKGCSEEVLYQKRYLERLKENTVLTERKVNLINYGRIDITYLVVFFGVGLDGRNAITSLCKDRYNPDLIRNLLAAASLKPKRESKHWLNWAQIASLEAGTRGHILTELVKHRTGQKFDAEMMKTEWLKNGEKYIAFRAFYPDEYEKFYGGHQFRLGHYFRHLYQTVTFVNDIEQLTDLEQYGYVRHLRGQLSTAEQKLIFLNSLSQLGRIWEMESRKQTTAVPRWEQLISDYGIIKNIPGDEIFPGILLSDFYPGIIYESFEVPESKIVVKQDVNHPIADHMV